MFKVCVVRFLSPVAASCVTIVSFLGFLGPLVVVGANIAYPDILLRGVAALLLLNIYCGF